MTQRLAAGCALALVVVAVALTAMTVVSEFPHGPAVLVCIVPALGCGWYRLVRRGVARVAGLGCAALLVSLAVALLIAREPVTTSVIVAAMGLALPAARVAFRTRVELPRALSPRRAVLFFNPGSGGGKAAPSTCRARHARAASS